jgi:Rrf2 family cysteine metabolism transcriptional repressor
MKFSTRTLYGLKAILVLAGRHGEGSLSVSQISKKEGISTAYLEQILNSLKKKGLVKSVRGPQGGYVLSKKPAEITLEALFYALDDKPAPAPNPKTSVTPESGEVAVSNAIFWEKLRVSIQKGLSEVTLKDLIDEARSFKKGKTRPHYTFAI